MGSRRRQIHVQLNRMLGSCAIVGEGAEQGEINAFSIDGELGKTSRRWPRSKYARKVNGFFFQSEKGAKGLSRQRQEPEPAQGTWIHVTHPGDSMSSLIANVSGPCWERSSRCDWKEISWAGSEWHHSPHPWQWGVISGFGEEQWHECQFPPSNMVIFLEESGSWNTSIPLASLAPCLSPACTVNWKISELYSALSSNITKQKYLVGLQLMSVLTIHSKAFESRSVSSPMEFFGSFLMSKARPDFYPKVTFFCGLSAPRIEIPRLIPHLLLKQRSHCGTPLGVEDIYRFWRLFMPSTTLEGLAYNCYPTPPCSSEDEILFFVDQTWALTIWHHQYFAQGVSARWMGLLL